MQQEYWTVVAELEWFVESEEQSPEVELPEESILEPV